MIVGEMGASLTQTRVFSKVIQIAGKRLFSIETGRNTFGEYLRGHTAPIQCLKSTELLQKEKS